MKIKESEMTCFKLNFMNSSVLCFINVYFMGEAHIRKS